MWVVLLILGWIALLNGDPLVAIALFAFSLILNQD